MTPKKYPQNLQTKTKKFLIAPKNIEILNPKNWAKPMYMYI